MTYEEAIEKMAKAICRDNLGEPDDLVPFAGKFFLKPQWKMYESAAHEAAREIGLIGLLVIRDMSKAHGRTKANKDEPLQSSAP